MQGSAYKALLLAVSGLLLSRDLGRGSLAEPLVGFRLSNWRNGDLVFRRGLGLASRIVLETDPGTRFSHVGLVRKTPRGVFVLHASPADGDHKGAVVMEPLDLFLAPNNAEDAAIFRAKDPRLANRAARAAFEWARRGVPFDEDFDLKTADRLYCTEMVWRAFAVGGIDLVDGRFDRLDLPFYHGLYLLPSRLLSSRHLSQIYPPSDGGSTACAAHEPLSPSSPYPCFSPAPRGRNEPSRVSTERSKRAMPKPPSI